MDWIQTLQVISVGMLIGTLIGLTGLGGGSILTPILLVLFGIEPMTALGTGFVVGALTRAAGGWNHVRLGHVDLLTVRSLLRGSLPGIIGGFGVLKIIDHYPLIPLDAFLRHAIGIALIIVALSIFFPLFWSRLQRLAAQLSESRRGRWITIYSFLTGILISITSVGTGSLFVPFLLAFFPGSLPGAIGVNVVHGAIITGVSALLHGVSGSVDWELAFRLLAGMVPGILLGSQLSAAIPKRILELIVASTLLTTSLKLI